MQNLPIIICALVGIILLVVEMFMPGFGLPGVAGIVFLLASIVFTWKQHGAYAGLGATLIVLSLAGILVTTALKSASSGRIWRSDLILKDSMTKADDLTENQELARLIGKEGTTLTVLRPAGIADLSGERVNVVSQGEFLEKGVQIIVEEVEGSRVVVRRLG